MEDFTNYLHKVKNTSDNTIMSYGRDLRKFEDYLGTLGISDIKSVTEEHLNGFP